MGTTNDATSGSVPGRSLHQLRKVSLLKQLQLSFRCVDYKRSDYTLKAVRKPILLAELSEVLEERAALR
jgi:hypothetical protein